MFKSRKGALLFAAAIVIGAVTLVGTEEEGGTLTEASDDIAAQRADFAADMVRENALSQDAGQVDDEEDIEGWDEDLDDEDVYDDESEGDLDGESTDPLVDTENSTDADEFSDVDV